MSPDDRWRIQHMIDAASLALRFVEGRHRTDLDNDEMLAPAPTAPAPTAPGATGRIWTTTRCCAWP